jgi:hypothetical protein
MRTSESISSYNIRPRPSGVELESDHGPFELEVNNKGSAKIQEMIRLKNERDRIRREEVTPLQEALKESEERRKELEARFMKP